MECNKIPQMPERIQNSNKGTFGKVLNVSGSEYMSGAAYLSSVAALKSGCGYCLLLTDKNIMQSIAAHSSDIVFADYNKLDEYFVTANVLLIGCGLSVLQQSVNLFKTVLSKVKNTPVIIDADGLNILSELYYKKDKDILEFLSNIPNLILTPHPKEASRLLNISLEEVLENKELCANKISQRFNCITVLKSHRTIITDKNKNIYTNQYGNSALAKAGSGDVLAGMIAGLLAQKMQPFEGAILGVYLHSIAGEIASDELTEYSVLASDLLNYIPQAIANHINQQI